MARSSFTITVTAGPQLRIWVTCMAGRMLRGGPPPSDYEIDRALERWVWVRAA